MMSSEVKKDQVPANTTKDPEGLKKEPVTPFARGGGRGNFGGRGGRGSGPGNERGGGRGGRGGFNNQQGPNRHESPAPGGQRGGGRSGMGAANRGGNGGGAGERGAHGGGNRFDHQGGGGRGGFDRVLERLQTVQGPTTELPNLDTKGIKFSGRSRLYIGNLSNDVSEENLKEMLVPYGEVGEIFYNREKKFAFLRMATKYEAEKAKRELDGQVKNGQSIKVRFAPHQAAIKVQNLGPWVSNELLHRAFSIYGDIEKALVYVDDRGRTKGEGIVEFVRKPSALEAIKRCTEGCYFLTASIRPVIAELDESTEDDDGLQDKMLMKRNQEYQFERETGPRFADPGSFEFEYGSKWKALYEMKKQKLQALEREMKLEEDKLVAQMEFARYEHETEHLRAKLREREASRDQHKSQFEAREREMQEMLRIEQERRVREEEAMSNRMQQQDANIRQRQQENSLFMQAQELSTMLDQQEADIQNRNNSGPAFGGPSNSGPSSFNNRGGNFRGPQNDKPPMNAGPGFGGPGFGGRGGMNIFNDGPGGPFPGNFGGPGGPGMFQNGPGGSGGPINQMGPRRWENNEDNGPNKRRRF